MTPLTQELSRYLAIRRSLGHDLRTAERILKGWITCVDQSHNGRVTLTAFNAWKETFGHANQATWAHRYQIVRLFSEWLHSLDPQHERLPKGLLRQRQSRAKPHIFSDSEIRQIVEAASQLPSVDGMRGLTYSTLFGLIAVTGVRIGECLALDTTDFDHAQGSLFIRHGKGKTERHLSLSESTIAKVQEYVNERNRLLGMTPASMFVNQHGLRISEDGARYNFALIGQQIGLRSQQRFKKHGVGPRIHDLRHTFAVKSILSWYRRGLDCQTEMFKLSTYLGHANPENTYWYIEAVPELMELALARATGEVGGDS